MIPFGPHLFPLFYFQVHFCKRLSAFLRNIELCSSNERKCAFSEVFTSNKPNAFKIKRALYLWKNPDAYPVVLYM